MRVVRLPLREHVEAVLLEGGAEENGVDKHGVQQRVVRGGHLHVQLLLGFAGAREQPQVQEARVLRLAQHPGTAIGVQVDHCSGKHRESFMFTCRLTTASEGVIYVHVQVDHSIKRGGGGSLMFMCRLTIAASNRGVIYCLS